MNSLEFGKMNLEFEKLDFGELEFGILAFGILGISGNSPIRNISIQDIDFGK